MNNLEWLKNVHSVLSQVLELSDNNNPVFGSWMEFAEKAAKQISNSLSVPYMQPFTQEDVDERPNHRETASYTAGDKATGNNTPLNALGVLDLVHNALKQYTMIEPFIKNLLKDKSTAGPSIKSPFTSGSDTAGRVNNNSSFLSSLLVVLLPVFLLIFLFRFR